MTERKYACNKLFSILVGPNIEADFLSAYNNVQVGGAPNKEADFLSAYNNVQVGVERNKFC
ncbi:hypothetical protein CKO30_11635 [Staphylococcus aureus]|nr:hypothetical protein CKO30_11635 [Staphylococcus aureus]